ncbi:cytochrome P450 [Streptomyces acidiscabies]|uniref:cytochrome P450 n=1 Tax=Streptomyces acidiscabies TaxID=42234 RepID=UPI00073E1B14|nr:cytochrome P450 [Streptomyces acidiscabies]GAQ52501.1 cytochrome P450-SU1 [Streptomyces acidiscabies]
MLRYPFDRANSLSPMPHLDLLRQNTLPRVLMPSGHPAHLAVRRADVQQALSDPRLSRRAMFTTPGGPRFTLADLDEPSLIGVDPPDHTRLRRLCAPAFRPPLIHALRAPVQRLADHLLRQPTDLHAEFSVPLVTHTVCDLLGVPRPDRAQLLDWAHQKLSLTGPPDEARAGHQALRDHFTSLTTEPNLAPGLLADLTQAHRTGHLSRRELTAVAVNLFVAGTTTTAAVLTNGLLCLLNRPAQYAALTPALVPQAVTEILRFDAAGDMSFPRLALVGLRIGATDVRAGEAVIPAHAYADRDPAVYPDPDVFDITRRPVPHLAFGYGPHYCVGARLAVLLLETALAAVVTRFPQLRLAVPARELGWRNGALTGGVGRLPVAW